MLKKEELAYLAGVVDSEAYVTIDKGKHYLRYAEWFRQKEANPQRKSRTDRNSFHYYYRPRVEISNTCLDLINWLHNKLGGKIYLHRPAGKNFHRKNLYRWFVRGKDAKNLLQDIFEWLIVKKQHAIVMLQFPTDRSRCPEVREVLYREIRQLNKAGRSRKKELDSSTSKAN